MKISKLLDNILYDMDGMSPTYLNEIVWFIDCHEDVPKITLLIVNSNRSSEYFASQCECLLDDLNPVTDIQLAGLLVIASRVDASAYREILSRTSAANGECYWARSIATSHLLQEVMSETIRISA